MTNHKLTGDALLLRLRELQGLPKERQAIACGYVIQSAGEPKPDMTGFLYAYLEAKEALARRVSRADIPEPDDQSDQD